MFTAVSLRHTQAQELPGLPALHGAVSKAMWGGHCLTQHGSVPGPAGSGAACLGVSSPPWGPHTGPSEQGALWPPPPRPPAASWRAPASYSLQALSSSRRNSGPMGKLWVSVRPMRGCGSASGPGGAAGTPHPSSTKGGPLETAARQKPRVGRGRLGRVGTAEPEHSGCPGWWGKQGRPGHPPWGGRRLPVHHSKEVLQQLLIPVQVAELLRNGATESGKGEIFQGEDVLPWFCKTMETSEMVARLLVWIPRG